VVRRHLSPSSLRKALRGLVAACCVAMGACGEIDDFIYYNSSDFLAAPIPWNESQARHFLPTVTTSLQCDREPSVNRKRMADTVKTVMAAHPDTRLVVFAETITGWYFDESGPRRYAESLAEPENGPSTILVQSLAQQFQVYIAFGWAERRGSDLYNALSVVSPEGEVVGTHRKRTLTGFDVQSGYQPGDSDTVVDIDGIRVGLLICMDRQDVRLSTLYAREDIKIIIHSIADNDDERIAFNYVARTYGKWIVQANRFGAEGGYFYDGSISIADPAGTYRFINTDEASYGYHRIGVY
jgi:5-aminopentanamidase